MGIVKDIAWFCLIHAAFLTVAIPLFYLYIRDWSLYALPILFLLFVAVAVIIYKKCIPLDKKPFTKARAYSEKKFLVRKF